MTVVIADDLTGGNGTGVMTAKNGLRACTIFPGSSDLPDLSNYSCVILPTGSRGLAPAEAALLVQQAAQRTRHLPVTLYAKRIDSTLRGNIGAEVDSLLDWLGDDCPAFIVPAFPQAGRIMAGGFLLLNGVPLHRTSVAQDPKRPVTTSRIEELLVEQSKRKTASIYLDKMAAGKEALLAHIQALYDDGARLIVFDAAEQEDVALICDAVLQWPGRFISVDPGPFTATLTQRMASSVQTQKRVLFAIGSVNAMAAAQVKHMEACGSADIAYINTTELLEGGDRCAIEIERVAGAIKASQAAVCGVVSSGIVPENRVPFEAYTLRRGKTAEELSDEINSAFAQVVASVLAQGAFDSIFTSGGDITEAVCRSLGAGGLALQREVLPLTAYARLVGGLYDGLSIITKGGMVGGAETLMDCIAYLQNGVSV